MKALRFLGEGNFHRAVFPIFPIVLSFFPKGKPFVQDGQFSALDGQDKLCVFPILPGLTIFLLQIHSFMLYYMCKNTFLFGGCL